MENPFESPTPTEPNRNVDIVELRERLGHSGVQTRHFRMVGLFMAVVGGAACVPAMLVAYLALVAITNRGGHSREAAIVFGGAAVVLAFLMLLIVTGRGLMNF